MENKVKKMYTDYTYPPYSEYMDKHAPVPHQYSTGLFPEQINHYIYKGKKKNFINYSILVVGVGLGSDIINMGYLLRKYKNKRMVGIDLSSTSLDVCKKRLQKYNLENDIELIEMSLLDLDPQIHGKFDCIICCGVLHHLENPQKGLNSLKNVLKDDGFMYIMVYGKYGRTGVYHMQDLMKKINYNENSDDFPNKIKNFKAVYKELPKNNWFKKGEHLISDHKCGDEGIVDLILHHQDRSYDIKELYEWINNSNLNIIDFIVDSKYKLNYEIKGIEYPKNIIDKYSINEIFFSDIIKYNFYVSKNKNTTASIYDLDNIMILVFIQKEDLNTILEYYKSHKTNSIYIKYDMKYTINDIDRWREGSCIEFDVIMNDIIYTILNNIDNKITTRKIFDIVREKLNIETNNDELLKIFLPVYEKFQLYDLILLKSSL